MCNVVKIFLLYLHTVCKLKQIKRCYFHKVVRRIRGNYTNLLGLVYLKISLSFKKAESAKKDFFMLFLILVI